MQPDDERMQHAVSFSNGTTPPVTILILQNNVRAVPCMVSSCTHALRVEQTQHLKAASA